MNRFACIILILFISISCSRKQSGIEEGIWRGVIELQGQELPFNFTVKKQNNVTSITLLNSEERLLLDSIGIVNDSLFARMHLFDSEIRARIDGNYLSGYFIKNYTKDYKLPFRAEHGNARRFEKAGRAGTLAKRFKIHFSNKPDSVYAIGLFKDSVGKVTGTVITTTGDQRYLEGSVIEDSLFLSAFDGESIYLYQAKIQSDSSLTGVYRSGKTLSATFTAIPNDTIELPDASKLTYLRPGFETFDFSFPGITGGTISLKDKKYQGKVVIVQILGSWCPNCMDESRFLAPWYKKNKERGVEIIGLAYEKKNDFNYAKERLAKMTQRLGIEYDLAFAGSSEKDSVSKTLPMLSSVLAFPTTIFVDKKGKVRKIHTGFSGPGAGNYYDQFIEEFNNTVNTLLQEK